MHYDLHVGGLVRHLPIVPVNDKLAIASFVILGDCELVTAVAPLLAAKLPEVDYLVTAEAKGIPLVQEMCRVMGMPYYVVARKSVKPYMTDPLSSTVVSITTQKPQTLCLDSADARSNFRVVSEKGSRLPVHCTSQGKLLLAYMPPAQRRSLLRSCDFAAYTPHSHTSLASLEGEMEQILRQGYAIENGELRIGLRSVAAPVFNVAGEAAYAVCVVGMFRRVNSPELERATKLLLDAAERISFELGYRGPLHP